MTRFLLILLLPFLMAFEDAPLSDPALEARALELMDEIRCVACENEPISQSGAEIASDMRQRVRMMIAEGGSDAEVRAWFVDRYGEFVLFRPAASGVAGLVLWGLPFALLLIGGGCLGVAIWRKNKGADGLVIVPVASEATGALDNVNAGPEENSAP